MDGEKKPLVKEDSLLLDVLVKLGKERLTRKQKQILKFLSKNEGVTATSLVRILSKELDCSRSALWNNLTSLKRAGLTKNKTSEPVKLTGAGILIAEVANG